MKVIARFSAWLLAWCPELVFPLPPVVILVATFHLMGRRRGAPGEPVRKLRRGSGKLRRSHKKLP